MNDRRVRGVDAVFLPVSDLGRSVEWYTVILGLEIVFHDKEHRAANMRASGNSPGICLVQVNDHRPIAFPDNDFLTDIFFNYRVSDLEAFHTHVIDQGVDVGDIYTSFDGTFQCFAFDDPDGNRISIVA